MHTGALTRDFITNHLNYSLTLTHACTAGSPHRMRYCPCSKFMESLLFCIGRTKAQSGCRGSGERDFARHPTAGSTTKKLPGCCVLPGSAAQPLTQCHRSLQCPAPVGTPGGAARATGGLGQGHSQGTDDGGVAHKGQPGSAEGAWDPSGAQVAPQPGQVHAHITDDGLQLQGGAQHRTDVEQLVAVSCQAERPSTVGAGEPCTAPAASSCFGGRGQEPEQWGALGVAAHWCRQSSRAQGTWAGGM